MIDTRPPALPGTMHAMVVTGPPRQHLPARCPICGSARAGKLDASSTRSTSCAAPIAAWYSPSSPSEVIYEHNKCDGGLLAAYYRRETRRAPSLTTMTCCAE